MRAYIVRPPLVYGPGVRANFLRLMNWVNAGIPLPFAGIQNRRSIVSVWNLCDLIGRVLQEDTHVIETPLLVSDGTDVSTPQLIEEIARSMRRPSRLFALPQGVIRLMGAALGRREEILRLIGSFAADINETRRSLNWSPPVPWSEGISRTVSWYVTRRDSG